MKAREALEVLGTVTAEQWGMVTGQQATALGVDAVTLHRLQKIGHLERVRHGVYAVTTATVTDARDEQAAWLWLNPTAPAWTRPPLDPDGGVVSHQSAARLHQLGELVNDRITFTTPRRRTSRDPDLHLITRTLAADDVTTIDGLPVTTALRTICDLAAQHTDGSHLGTIIRQAVEAGLVQLDVLAEHLGPYALRYGVRPAGDGEALLEHLLAEIGTSTAELAHRPAPLRTETARVLTQLTPNTLAALNELAHRQPPSRTEIAHALTQLSPDMLAALTRPNSDLAHALRQVAALANIQDALAAMFASGIQPVWGTNDQQNDAVHNAITRSGMPGLLAMLDVLNSQRKAFDSTMVDTAVYGTELQGAGLAVPDTADGEPDTGDGEEDEAEEGAVGDGEAMVDDEVHAAAASPHPEELPGLPEGKGQERGGQGRRDRG